MSSTWYAQRIKPKEEAGAAPDHGTVDYFSLNIRRTSLDESGRAKNLLVAPVLTHYIEDNHTELTSPVYTVFSKEENPPWVISSEHGTIKQDGTIALEGAVLIQRDADRNGRSVRLTTSNATIDPNRDYAETSEHIEVVSAPDLLTGDGAQVHFGDQLKITILSNVRRKHDVR
ncbi:MAG: LPS export ABC transporter periplasmic protein LptC [Methylococcus sp.]|nr:LPS export ABC transporter periplasmic protein LptC [Methylococcus sp.]